MAVKIKLKRLGKMRNPQYRIVVADARTKRDGRVDRGDRQVPPQGGALAHRGRLRAGAVLARRRRAADRARRRHPQGHRRLAEVQGPARRQEGTLQVAEPKADKKATFEAAAKETLDDAAKGPTTTAKDGAAKAATPGRGAEAEVVAEVETVEAETADAAPRLTRRRGRQPEARPRRDDASRSRGRRGRRHRGG